MQIGGSFGAAVLAAVLQHRTSGGIAPSAAYAHAFRWTLAFTALGFAPALLLGRTRPPPHEESP